MLFSIKTFLSLIKIGFISQQIYRLASLFLVCSSIILVSIQYYLWKAIYESSIHVPYLFDSIIYYIVFSQILFAVYPSKISKELAKSIRKGEVIYFLLKPYSLFKTFFYQCIGCSLYTLVYIVLPIFAFSLILIDININMFGFQRILPLMVIFIFSYFFMFMVEWVVGLCTFFMLNNWGIQSLKHTLIILLSGRLLPISLYPDWLKQIVEILPFKLMYYVPVSCVINVDSELDFSNILVEQVMWVFIVFISLLFFQNIVFKKISIQGG